jgi:hypothetical protein
LTPLLISISDARMVLGRESVASTRRDGLGHLFLAMGVRVTKIDVDGRSPLHYAAMLDEGE